MRPGSNIIDTPRDPFGHEKGRTTSKLYMLFGLWGAVRFCLQILTSLYTSGSVLQIRTPRCKCGARCPLQERVPPCIMDYTKAQCNNANCTKKPSRSGGGGSCGGDSSGDRFCSQARR